MAAVAMLAPTSAHAEDLPATPATFASVWTAAQGGDRVLLAAGSYGKFTAIGTKASPVTIRPQPGASASMALAFDGASNVRLENLTITDLAFTGTTSNVTVTASRFTGPAVIRADRMVNANVVLDGNSHASIDVGGCDRCYEGRIQVTGKGPGPSGVTIRNSVIGPGGDADGMQINAVGVQVLNNEFVGIRQVGQVHTDSLQLYGAEQTTIRGNYFHDFDVAIMAPDGGSHEHITDNVFVGSGSYRPAIQLGGHRGTVFAHNVTKDIDVYVDAKSGEPPGTDNVARDNVVINGTIQAPAAKCGNCTLTHNLFTSSASSRGSSAIVATPVFVGGSAPATWAGYVLAATSPGKGSGSDGTDRGIRVDAVGGPSAPVPLQPPPPSAGLGLGSARPKDLIAAYGFNEPESHRALDTSGGGHHARLRGARYTRTARAGMALAFDGRASLRIPRSATRKLRVLTLEAWTRPTARRRHRVLNVAGQPALGLRLRRWSHVAVIRERSRLRIYVNGKLVSSRRARSRPVVGQLALGGRGFRGQIDDVRIYRRALTRANVRADMKKPV